MAAVAGACVIRFSTRCFGLASRRARVLYMPYSLEFFKTWNSSHTAVALAAFTFSRSCPIAELEIQISKDSLQTLLTPRLHLSSLW
jgi:hypothetical protein